MGLLITLEWTATVLSMAGAFSMSLKIGRSSEVLAWPLWITSGILLIHLYSSTGQTGLMVGQLLGLISSGMGLVAWFAPDSRSVLRLCKCCRLMAYIGIFTLSMALVQYISSGLLQDLAWIGAMASSTGAFVMACRSRFSHYAWLFWLLGNAVILFVASRNGHHGVVTMSLCYTALNLLGMYRWFSAQKQLARIN